MLGYNSKEIIMREKRTITDFFICIRTYGKAVNRKTIESLIDADCLVNLVTIIKHYMRT